MKTKFLKSFSLILFSIIMLSFTDGNDEFINQIIEKLSLYNEKFPTEKVYVQLDKSVYKPGDDLWFKAYVTETATKGSTYLSKGLKLKLYNQSGQSILEQKYLIENSMVNGNLTLPKTLPDGIYTVIAFSSWMENDSLNRVYKKYIEIRSIPENNLDIKVTLSDSLYNASKPINASVSIKNILGEVVKSQKVKYTVEHNGKKIIKGELVTDNNGNALFTFTAPAINTNLPIVITIKAKNNGQDNMMAVILPSVPNNVNLNFFPEGGNLIKGIRTKIAFKAFDEYNTPVNVQGEIVNENNQVVASFSTLVNGMGVFYVLPQNGDQLKARITKPAGIAATFNLPATSDNGLYLSVLKNTPDTIFFKIESDNKENIENTTIIAQVRGSVYWAGVAPFKGIGVVKIPKQNLPSGILQVIVFNSSNDLKAQRLVYIENPARYSLTISTDKNEYNSKEKVTVKIKMMASDNKIIPSSISLSATKKQNNIINNPDIFFENNLFSELNNQHLIPFIDYNYEKALDLLLMTSNLSHYNWVNISSINKDIQGPNSKDGLSGIVYDKKNKPLANARINVLNSTTYSVHQAISDKDGWFEIPGIGFNQSPSLFSITAISENGDKNTKVVLGDKFSASLNSFIEQNPCFTNPYLSQTCSQNAVQSIDIALMLAKEGIVVNNNKEVKQAVLSPEEVKREQYNSARNILDLIFQIKPYKIIDGMIVFPLGVSSDRVVGAIVVIDGVISSISIIDVSQVEDIKILTTPSETSRYTSFASGGIIEITTKKGKAKSDSKTDPLTKVNGYKENNQFKSPDYSATNLNVVDNRLTLYWNPEINLNEAGEATATFFTSDIKGNFTLTIEGFTQNGVPVFGNTSLLVK